MLSNRFFNSEKYFFREISSGTFNSKNVWSLAKTCLALSSGCWSVMRFIRKFRPDVILGFGSYHSFPALIIGALFRIPLILHEQNIVPGQVNRIMGRFSKGIGIVFPECRRNFKVPAQAVYTCSNMTTPPKRKLSDDYENLEKDRFTILVFGGSSGSEWINRLMFKVVFEMRKRNSHFQVIHLIGHSDHLIQEACASYSRMNIPFVVKAFENDMDAVMRIADIAICRAGSGTLQDLIKNELPAVLIPYPGAYAHQKKNADFFTNVIKGGMFFEQHLLHAEDLIEYLSNVICKKSLHFEKLCLRRYRESLKIEPFTEFIDRLLFQTKS